MQLTNKENIKKRIANVGSDVENDTINGIIAINIWSSLLTEQTYLIIF